MKSSTRQLFHTVWSTVLGFMAFLAIAFSPISAFTQDQLDGFEMHFKSFPLSGITPEQAMQESLNGTTVPMWTYKQEVCLPHKAGELPICFDYNGQIMGADPKGNTTTSIPVYIVPLTIIINGTTFDPSVSTSTCPGSVVPTTAVANSPLFNNAPKAYSWGSPPVNFGATQYIDALQRAEFWPSDKGWPNWHTIMQYNTSPVAFKLNASTFGSIFTAPCGTLGVINTAVLDSIVQNTILPTLQAKGIGPTTLPVILMSNVVMADTGCCTFGYHNAVPIGGTMQAYAVSLFDTTQAFKTKTGKLVSQDVAVLSHELGEAVNDPTAKNVTPGWGHVGQQPGCQFNFEVGDPLTGQGINAGMYPAITMSGFTYHLQELAMFTWFYHANAGLGWFSTNGTFTSDAVWCGLDAPAPGGNIT